MGEIRFKCPFCGLSHLFILGGTVVTDKDGHIVVRCPEGGQNG